MTTATNAEPTMKPRFNPHPKNTELARAYEAGWRKGYLQSAEMLDHVTEVIVGARFCHELFAGRESKRNRARA
jgi:hypothetical protein